MHNNSLLLLLFLSLSACADALPQDKSLVQKSIIIEKKEIDVDALVLKAAAGDKTAQYQLGREFCCVNPKDNAPNTAVANDEATGWLCDAARAGLPAAQLRLGELYSGDLFNLPSWDDYMPQQKTSGLRQPLITAFMWYEVAAEAQHADAIGGAIRLKNRMSEEEVAAARLLKQNWTKAPCLWGEVF